MNELHGKIVLVTGATGLIGSHLVERLLAEGAKVIAVGRSEEKLQTVFKDKLCDNNFSYAVGNIAEKIPDRIKNVDFIFHAASPIAGQEIKDAPVNVIEANLMGARNCLEYLKEQKKRGHEGRLIVFSSVTVYGNDLEDDKIVEENDTDIAESLDAGNAAYSESKRMIEVVAKAYARQYGIDSVIARIGYVYGFVENAPNTAFYEFINKAVRGEDIILNNSGMARRDNIYISDVIDGLLILCAKGKAGESYNISSFGEKGNFKAIDEIAEMISASINMQATDSIRVIKKQNMKKRSAGVLVDNHKLKALGWSLKVGMEEGIGQIIQSYLELENNNK